MQLQNQTKVCFNRAEIQSLLSLYGRKVAEGEWRDYAIDMLKDQAIFSIYRHTSESPIYQIHKEPALAHRQGAYSLKAGVGQTLKRGRDLDLILAIFAPRQLYLVD